MKAHIRYLRVRMCLGAVSNAPFPFQTQLYVDLLNVVLLDSEVEKARKLMYVYVMYKLCSML